MCMALEQVGSHCDDILDPCHALEKRITGVLNEGNEADRKKAGGGRKATWNQGIG